MPQNPAGIRIDPPASVPNARGPIPRGTAAALPPLEPPETFVGSHGLRVTPSSGLSVTPFQPNSGVVVLPKGTKPPRRRAAIAGASTFTGSLEVIKEPLRLGQPLVMKISLTATGTPSIGPNGVPRRQRSSLRRAAVIVVSSSSM